MAEVLPMAVRLTGKSSHKTALSLAHPSQKLKLSSVCVKELKRDCDACLSNKLYCPYSHCQPTPQDTSTNASSRKTSVGRKRGRRTAASDDEKSLSKDITLKKQTDV
eukprot:5074847-Pleurochrysis_carterae.AAC.1